MGYQNTPYLPDIASLDPAAVDFRAFYPYTPNEVKHRKRTTSSQLKVLEAIFKRDTKPNANLRTELAAQLGMTARGVQVWFQNRRAKEKVKAGKASLGAKGSSSTASQKQEECSSPLIIKGESLSSDSLLADAALHDDLAQHRDAFSRSPTSSSSTTRSSHNTSPPQLHLVTDADNYSWQDSPVELPPDSATSFSSRPPMPSSRTAPAISRLGVGSDEIYPYRRGSLPANAFPQPQPSSDIDVFDPLNRRRSVDASLQKLAFNPFASLARAKNSALYGPGFGVVMPGTSGNGMGAGAGGGLTRHLQISRLPPYGCHQHQRRGVSSLTSAPSASHFASMPQHASMRRSSMDSRSTRLAQMSRFHQTPSPSPLTPYNAVVRASLPEHHLYAVTARTVVSPIPGPLPSPGFSFGAASSSTPSMASPSSGDSERNSPDSFTFRGEETEQDEDSATSPSYDAYSSRFGSIASIATSESSVNSAYYTDLSESAVEHAHLEERRDSCASGHFLGMLSGLDVGNHVEHMDHASMGLGIGSDVGYSPHEDYGFASAGEGLDAVGSDLHQQQHQAYPSPSSTILPTDSSGQNPHVQDAPASMPISTSSELAFALEDNPGQKTSSSANQQETYANYGGNVEHHTVAQIPAEQLQHEPSYYQQQQLDQQQQQQQHQDHNSSYASYSYSNEAQQQQLDYYSSTGTYVDTLSAASTCGLDSGLQSVEAFVAYT